MLPSQGGTLVALLPSRGETLVVSATEHALALVTKHAQVSATKHALALVTKHALVSATKHAPVPGTGRGGTQRCYWRVQSF